jgi:hypothetical protein
VPSHLLSLGQVLGVQMLRHSWWPGPSGCGDKASPGSSLSLSLSLSLSMEPRASCLLSTHGHRATRQGRSFSGFLIMSVHTWAGEQASGSLATMAQREVSKVSESPSQKPLAQPRADGTQDSTNPTARWEESSQCPGRK